MGIVADGLDRGMLMAVEKQVGPDLIRNDPDIVLFKDLHSLPDLIRFPDAAAGIVGTAEDGGVDFILHDLLFHIFIVHSPDAGSILHQRVTDEAVSVILQSMPETDIERALDQHGIPAGAQDVQGGDDAAQHAVFIADMLCCETGDTVTLFLPADDGLIVFL